MTIQALSSSISVPALAKRQRSFVRRFVEAVIEGRQLKADLFAAEYLDRHPEYRDLHARAREAAGGVTSRSANR